MTSELVIDASITLTWCFEDEATDATRALLLRMTEGAVAAVPAHWSVEVLNSLIQGKKRGRIDDPRIERVIRNLSSFTLLIDTRFSEDHLRTIRTLAERHSLTSYDAAYLELAMRLSVPLASLDKALHRAAQAENVTML